jgi:hypothetical protein
MVTTIPDAIRKVGSAAVRNIATALGVFDVMPESSGDGFNPIRCWQHSFAVAQVCEQLTAVRDPDQAGLAYVVGLCHDLAEIFIHTQFRAEYEQVLATTAATGRPRDQLEREMLGMTHAELATTICKCIGLPDAIREPVEILHGPRPERTTHALARVLWLAENYANGIMLASSPGSRIAPLPQALCLAATGKTDPPPPDAATLRSEVMSMTAMLARLSRGDEASLMAPLFERTSVRVWLAREAGVSAFDPFEAALNSTAAVHVADRLPDLRAAAGADRPGALVVVTRTTNAAGLTQPDIMKCVESLGQDGRPLPLLWVSANRSEASLLPGGPAPVLAPIALDALAAFVESAVQPVRAAAA